MPRSALCCPGMGLASTFGLATRSDRELLAHGAVDWPRDSLMGLGHMVAQVPFSPQLLTEIAPASIFMTEPVAANYFHGSVLAGLGISMSAPTGRSIASGRTARAVFAGRLTQDGSEVRSRSVVLCTRVVGGSRA